MNILKKLFYVEHKWNIGILNNFSQDELISQNLHKQRENIFWIGPNNKNDFYADPMITTFFGRTLLFIEEWIDTEKKGIISCINLSETIEKKNSHPPTKHILDFPTHLSFPFLFEYNNKLYMVPENYQSNAIKIYEAGRKPDEWWEAGVLIENFPGIDTVIFEYNSTWWMFSTKFDYIKNGDDQYNLYIWHSNSPLHGWKEHPMSPIHYSEPTARGAGAPFVSQNKLYRPAQDCRGGYGKGLFIYEITELTKKKFSEKVFRHITPLPEQPDALHTYSCCNMISAIDGLKGQYDIRKPFIWLKFKVKFVLYRKKLNHL